MVRAPCCEKMGLKKGPWTPEEDQTLIAYIQKHGHGNWRALPKHAGLLRCGKSCRLRWINYLRPDIKRGNFSKEEEEAIINLHGLLGNRWSAIAAKLPGRTDNEIKNVWHTHLKKRLKQANNDKIVNDGEEEDNSPNKQQQPPRVQKTDQTQPTIVNNGTRQEESDHQRWYDEPITSPSSSSSLSAPTSTPTPHRSELTEHPMRSSSSDLSTASAAVSEGSSSRYEDAMKVKEEDDDRYVSSLENFPQILEEYNSCLWFQAMPMESFLDTTVMSSEEFTSAAPTACMNEQQRKEEEQEEVVRHQFPVCAKEDNDFWRDLFREAGDLTELPGF